MIPRTQALLIALVIAFALPALAPGQEIFGATTTGGWIRAPETLATALIAGGLPATPPGAGGNGFPALLAAGLAAAVVLVLALLALALRRRNREWPFQQRWSRRISEA